jgi:BirA family biotin operon repressor/biotin-[acetyl-CoA-carboxylase] ligase
MDIIIFLIFAIIHYMYSKFKIVFIERVSSTNDEIKKTYNDGDNYEFFVICAKDQTSGRGQRENKWHSLPSKNLTFSIAFSPIYINIQNQFYLSKVVSLAILNYLKSKTNDVKIKWPNDIYCDGKKICGTLIENSVSNDKIKQTIIGIGLNLNQTVFPEELNNATSLVLITNKEYDIKSELDHLLNEFEHTVQLLKQHEYTLIDKLYHENLFQIYRICNFKDTGGIFSGKIIGTLNSGKLVIEDEYGNIRSFNYKEVEFS